MGEFTKKPKRRNIVDVRGFDQIIIIAYTKSTTIQLDTRTVVSEFFENVYTFISGCVCFALSGVMALLSRRREAKIRIAVIQGVVIPMISCAWVPWKKAENFSVHREKEFSLFIPNTPDCVIYAPARIKYSRPVMSHQFSIAMRADDCDQSLCQRDSSTWFFTDFERESILIGRGFLVKSRNKTRNPLFISQWSVPPLRHAGLFSAPAVTIPIWDITLRIFAVVAQCYACIWGCHRNLYSGWCEPSGDTLDSPILAEVTYE